MRPTFVLRAALALAALSALALTVDMHAPEVAVAQTVVPAYVQSTTAAFVNDNSASGAAGTFTATATLPVVSSAGDTELFIGFDNGSASDVFSAASPFVALGSRLAASGSTLGLTSFTASGYAVTSSTMTDTAAGGFPYSMMLDFSGVASVTAGALSVSSASTTSFQCPSATVSVANSIIVYVAASQTTSSNYATATTGFTLAQQFTGGGYVSGAAFYSVAEPAGAVAGPLVTDTNSTTMGCVAYVMAPGTATPSPTTAPTTTPAPTASPTLAPYPTPAASAVTPIPTVAPAAASGAYSVRGWETTSDGTASFAAPIAPAALTVGSISGATAVQVTPGSTFQSWLGIGGAMTASAAQNIEQMPTVTRAALISAIFTPFTGAGANFIIVPIGASDLSPTNYTEDDNSGAADPSLAAQNMTYDDSYVVPVLQQALLLNPNLKIILCPWSAPAWMKTVATINGSSGGTNVGLQTNYYNQFASYIVRAALLMEQRGVPVYAVIPQNEPYYGPTYPGMVLSEPQMATLIGQNLGPQLASSGLAAAHTVLEANGTNITSRVQLIAYDDNFDQLVSYGNALLADATAGPYINGLAAHCYGGAATAIASSLSSYPSIPVYETECSSEAPGSGSGPNVESLAAQLSNAATTIPDIQNGASSVGFWSMAQNPTYGPANAAGCTVCIGYVTIAANGAVTKDFNFAVSAQIADAADSGARRIAITQPSGLLTTAFADPNGTHGVVVYNSGSAVVTVAITDAGFSYTFSASVPAGGVDSFRYGPSATVATLGTGTSSAPVPSAPVSRAVRRY